ncbi:hypothetical protein [Glycomyces algeriensis]|uniref:Type VII secretion system (Wss) protein ESAT-6 n=1 Tax=Glycomyces algeriensis TaxID=256037 RepID=A0A9W6G5N2_9ACTN|nr:hypothetical protein [Glycomyces algeriensis]MDA1367557.1 hypothetical protein [Glycomyces algeriensis]MDR7353080.1 hypothetical protein [Glycomyces algeriensis]GLI40773.1 hypothetical protein GALLR39Z86_06230 [Glycomyces algeriensis]
MSDSSEHGSDITQYAPVQSPGAGERIANDIPLAKPVYGIAQEINDAVNGDTSIADAAGGIAADLGMLAAGGLMFIKDPVYALANAGLTILLELVTPLNDLLEMVSGDPGQMQQQQEVWGQVQEALGALGEEVGTAVESGIPNWQGSAADAAYNQLYGLSAAIGAMGHEAGGIKQLLAWAEVVAQTIYDVIKSILAELVSWLIMRGLVALAASSFTFGAAFAEFLISGMVKAMSAISRAIDKFAKAGKIFAKIAPLLSKFFLPAGKPLWKAVLMRGLITGGITAGLGAATTGMQQLSGGSGGQSASVSAGSPVGLTVDLDELDALASALEGLSGNGESINSVASGAASEEMTWGLTGLFFASSYQGSCEEAVASTGQLSGSLNGHGQILRDCKAAYCSSDEVAAAEFEAKYNELA